MGSVRVPAEWQDARLFIVDDDEPLRRLLQQLLVASGYTAVTTFADPGPALSAYGEDPPDLVLLDLHLPSLGGDELLRRMRSLDVEPQPPIIVMTGARQSQDVHQMLELGAADFLHKPIDATELMLRVRHQLRERQLRLQLGLQNDQLEQLAADRAGELALLSRVLDDIPTAAVVVEHDLRIRFANVQARGMLDAGHETLPAALSDEEVTRRELVDFLAASDASGPNSMPMALSVGGGAGRRVELETQRLEQGRIAVLIHDTEHRERITDALHQALTAERAANAELVKVEGLRTSFLNAVSHELRTPLTVVLGLVQTLKQRRESLGSDQRLVIEDRLEANAFRLAGLLDDLLDLNRLTAGRLSLDLARHPLLEIVHEAVESIETGTHTFEIDVPPVEVAADPASLRRVVANLARNAVVHAPTASLVHIGADVTEVTVTLRVVDRGPGVAPDLKERIFDAFEQGPSAPEHRPGTGIGLAIVREFVALHGGRVWVEDTAGGGATFAVELVREPDTARG